MKLSASLVKTYKQCRRKYELRYLEQLEPIEKSQALEDGSNYHQMLEKLYNGESISWHEGENPKICAMAMAYMKHLWFNHTEIKEVKSVEKWFEYKLTDDCFIVGRNDAVNKDGIPVEHKTTSSDIDDEYVYQLQWDEQILTYMVANDINQMIYTVIKKPTIRQKQNETDEDFFLRCLNWYNEDTDSKMRVINIYRTQEEIEEHRQNLIVIAKEIEECRHFYRNTTACNCYNRRCEYSSVCLHYNPELEYVEFEKKQRYADQKEESLF